MAFKIRSIFGSKEPGQEENTVTSESLATEDPSVEPTTETSFEQEATLGENEEEKAEKKEVVTEKELVEAAPPARTEKISEAPRPQPQRFRPKNVEELFLKALPERAQNGADNLKSILTQTVLFDIIPSGRKYLFEWNAHGCTVVETKLNEAKCTVQIHEKDVMKVADGDLNPQVLMLSHKARVSGDARSATYVFNLIAPVSNL